MKAKTILATGAALLALTLTGAACQPAQSPARPGTAIAQPRCPQEDSCQADYRGGAWFIRSCDGYAADRCENPGAWFRVTAATREGGAR